MGRRVAAKRGGMSTVVSIEAIEEALAAMTELAETTSEALLALDASVATLPRHSERQSKVVECRFFAGLHRRDRARARDLARHREAGMALAQAWHYRDLRERLS